MRRLLNTIYVFQQQSSNLMGLSVDARRHWTGWKCHTCFTQDTNLVLVRKYKMDKVTGYQPPLSSAQKGDYLIILQF